MKHPRLVIADDHRIFLNGLRNLLASKFEIVGLAPTGEMLVQLARRHKPELIVTDIGMPGLGGLEAAELLLREDRRAKVVILSMQDDTEVVRRAFRAGVSGYVTKNDAGAELIFALEEVLAGRTYISPYIARGMVNNWVQGPAAVQEHMQTEAHFTPRQIEVLRLISSGKTMKEVAAVLGISPRTAEVHKYQMMERLKVRTVPELVRCGIRLGIVEIGELDERGTHADCLRGEEVRL